MDLTVYTCVFGNTDALHEQPRIPGVRFVCFTDQPITPKTWEAVRMPRQARPTRSSRIIKALSHLFTDTEYSLWMDANFTLRVTDVALFDRGDFVNFLHRDRTRIAQEAAAIVRIGKGKADAIFGQLAAYQSEGLDTDENPMRELSCNGVLFRRHTPDVVRVNEAWCREIESRSLRDQMSLDYVCWKEGFTLSRWPGTFDRCRYFHWTYYKRPTNDY
ncbi:MAG TPA: glycosyltransferase domain-containing protein [Candidimonas sp.]|nr:glycosyltransferase domain-containing protein [Candidimonas sp.]